MIQFAANLSILILSAAHIALRAVRLSRKYPYQVLLEGSPLWWATDDGSIEEAGGFYTTRFVMADSREAAIARAIEIVSKDVEPIARNPADSPMRIRVDECTRLRGLVMRQGRGFGFWLESEETEQS